MGYALGTSILYRPEKAAPTTDDRWAEN